jgi:2-aminomuconate deaminase
MPNNRSRPVILDDRAQALARYPHARIVGSTIYVSGISSRRADNTHDGVTLHADGTKTLDIKAQTRAVLQNIDVILKAAGADLGHVVDITVFLVDMKDYAGMNEVYNEFFTKELGPARTTVAVHQLPHPNLLVEMKAIAHLGDPA